MTIKVYDFENFSNFNDKKKALKNALNECDSERQKKRNEVKQLTSEIRKLKRKLKTITNKIGNK